jgi:1-acyl-sn-glycerol-3-phosphate acyltransferase
MPKTPAIYVLNHQSSLDGMPLGLLRIRRLAIIGKKEVAYIPFIGWAFWIAGNVLVNRGDGKRARGQLDAGVDAIKNRGVSIAIFPEGSRNRDQEGFLPFKKGGFVMAIDAQVPIVPVVVESYKKLYDKVAGKMRTGPLKVRVLPAISTAGMQRQQAQQLTQQVENLMREDYQRIA